MKTLIYQGERHHWACGVALVSRCTFFLIEEVQKEQCLQKKSSCIDLNKVGVLIGAELEVGNDGKLRANPDNFHNTNGTFTAEEMTDPDNKFEFTLFVMNIYYVLLTRGIDGIRLGFWRNDAFRKYMEQTLDIE